MLSRIFRDFSSHFRIVLAPDIWIGELAAIIAILILLIQWIIPKPSTATSRINPYRTIIG